MTERRNLRKTGEDHPASRLTAEDVRQIRREAAIDGTSRAWLAQKYSVSTSTIQSIVWVCPDSVDTFTVVQGQVFPDLFFCHS